MTRLFAGTPFDRPPKCERCGRLQQDCACPPPEPQRTPPEQQRVKLAIEKRKKGKVVTALRGLTGREAEILGVVEPSQVGLRCRRHLQRGRARDSRRARGASARRTLETGLSCSGEVTFGRAGLGWHWRLDRRPPKRRAAVESTQARNCLLSLLDKTWPLTCIEPPQAPEGRQSASHGCQPVVSGPAQQ